MRLNKFETYGIGFSIAALALTLYLLEVKSVNDSVLSIASDTAEDAAVFVADDDNQRAAIANAILDASDDIGNVQQIIIDDVVIGDGSVVEEGDTVAVHYIGTLQNGQQFDNSYLRGEPFTFEIGSGRVIEGWNEGIAGMRVGGQRIIVIPSDFAYGEEGYGPIPGNATLVFALELLSVEE